MAGSFNGHAHHRIPFALQSKNEIGDEELRSLIDEIIDEANSNNVENVLLSSEVFFSLQEKDIHRFSELLVDQNVKILCYVRRQDQFLHSFYMQCIKHSQMRISDGPDDYKGFHEVVSIAQYDQILGWWASAFGDESIIAETYDKKSQSEGVIASFLSKLDINAAPETTNEARVNTTIRTELIEYLRVANTTGISSPQHEILLKKLNELSVKKGELFTNHKYLSPSDCLRIYRLYEEVNKNVKEKWFKHRDTLFDHPDTAAGTEKHNRPEIRQESLARLSAWLWLESQAVDKLSG